MKDPKMDERKARNLQGRAVQPYQAGRQKGRSQIRQELLPTSR